MRAKPLYSNIMLPLIAIVILGCGGCTAPTTSHLFHAIRSGDVQRVRQILAVAPQLVNVQDAKSGETPLIAAVRHCNLQIVQILLSYGADVHRADLGGLTALHYACANGCRVVIPLLVKQGASVNERDPSGLAPLHLAGNDPACIATLLSLGADPMVKTEGGELPIHFAASAQQPASLSLLLQAGNSANARDKDGVTPLMDALRPAIWRPTAKKCVELLLSYGAEANARDKVFGWTALHYLADFPLTFIKQEGGGSVYNLEQQEHLHIEVARVLIAAGCDPSQKDVAGRTAADIALRQGSVRIAEFLRKYERSKMEGRTSR